jgi:hypothetical protein
MYHPSHRVPDLDGAVRFFKEVFGRDCVPLATVQRSRDTAVTDGYPTDYAAFVLIADVWFDCIDPSRYVIDGVQRYETITVPQLSGFGWGVDGIEGIWQELRRGGIRCTDQRNVLADGEMPKASFSDSPLFWTLDQDTGLRYEIYPVTSIGPADPRSDPGWVLPPVRDDDPLGIEMCSHHTVLTTQPERALALVVDVLGGTVIHQGRNELLGTESTYVSLADGVLEYAVAAQAGGPAAESLQARAPLDVYYSLTWKVQDLDRVARHLLDRRVAVRTRTHDTIVVDPADGLGIPWVFTTVTVPNDPRVG